MDVLPHFVVGGAAGEGTEEGGPGVEGCVDWGGGGGGGGEGRGGRGGGGCWREGFAKDFGVAHDGWLREGSRLRM